MNYEYDDTGDADLNGAGEEFLTLADLDAELDSIASGHFSTADIVTGTTTTTIIDTSNDLF